MNPDPEAFDDETKFDDPALEAVADAILEGGPIDWSAADSSGSADPSLARQLRVLADLAAVHRTMLVGEATIVSDEEAAAARPTWGHLQLLEKVGQGAFGEVFRAWDPHLNREVALKLLGPAGPSRGGDSPSWVLEEARYLAAVRHPNVVTVHGADRIDGRVGFWTEFIHGRTLAELVHAQGVFSAADGVVIGIDACRAISAVHRAGLLHRDIKANNVMREDGSRIVLLDFGATKDFVQHAVADAVIGDPNGPTGTPLYVAPELWRDSAATPQSDIYSLGVLLYFLVTGSYPVRGVTVGDVGNAHRAGARVSLREERPDLPADFVAVVERAIDPDPSKRFDTIGAFESALVGVHARLSGTPGQNGSRWKNPALLVAAGILLALAGYAIFEAWQMRRLATVQQPPATVRRIPVPNIRMGRPSHDGRFVPVVDADGNLSVMEVATGRPRKVARGGELEGSAVTWMFSINPNTGRPFMPNWALAVMSPNNDQVAYTWATAHDAFELRVADADGGRARPLLPRQSEYEPVPVDWTPDGQVLCWLKHKSPLAELVLVSASDGSYRRMFSKSGGVPSTSLSPDGRFVTFDRVPAGSSGRTEVVVLDVQRALATGMVEPRPLFAASANEHVPAWVDDTHLLFWRRSAELQEPLIVKDGWVAEVVDGTVRGEPVRAISNLNNPQAAVIAGDGLLFVVMRPPWPEVYTASLDATGRAAPSSPAPISAVEFGHHLAPSWSPDGRSIVYFSARPSRASGREDSLALTINDLTSGQARTLPQKLAILRPSAPQWLSGGEKLLVFGGDQPSEDRLGYYEVDVRTADVRPIMLGITELSRLLPDGSGLVYLDDKRGLVQRKFGQLEETIVAPGPKPNWGRFDISRNSMLAFVTVSVGGRVFQTDTLSVNAGGGPARELAHADWPDRLDFQAWTPDGRHILFTRVSGGKTRLWMVSVAGGPERDMELELPNGTSALSVSPVGDRIVYQGTITGQELWIQPLPSTVFKRR